MRHAWIVAALGLLLVAPSGALSAGAPAPLAAGCGDTLAFDAAAPGDAPPPQEQQLEACWGKIRPGARMTSPAGCTMAWIVRDAAGALYQATAGHCVRIGDSVNVWGVGRIGDVVHRVCCGAGNDFALVKLDEAVYDRVDPTLCEWGGASSLGTAAFGEKVFVYGFGVLYQSAATTRSRVGSGWFTNTAYVQYVGMMQPGDSGAPVMTENGEAAGVHVQSSLGAGGVRIDPSMKYATRLDYALGVAEGRLGTAFDLVTSTEPLRLVPVDVPAPATASVKTDPHR